MSITLVYLRSVMPLINEYW